MISIIEIEENIIQCRKLNDSIIGIYIEDKKIIFKRNIALSPKIIIHNQESKYTVDGIVEILLNAQCDVINIIFDFRSLEEL